MSSLYIHIPYCLRKCSYCDFFSADDFSAADLDEYVTLLLLELNQLQIRCPATSPLQTLFFGGGTPSLLSVGQVNQLLRRIEAAFGFAQDCEITLEANPGTLSEEKLRGYRQAGVNRLSLGLQTLDDSQLQLLGRIHTAAEGRQAVAMARDAGFDNLSLDLIFALPGQTLERLEEDVAGLLEQRPEHLSLYGLTFEPETPLHRQLQAGALQEPDESVYADSYLLIDRLLAGAGFEHYEISNFARPGFRCRHNQVYWQRQECLAAGCGAHGFFATGWGERWYVPADLSLYRQRLTANEPVLEQLEKFDRRAAMAETLYLALRTRDGLSRQDFAERFKVFPEQEFPAAFSRLAERLRLESGRWRFDLQGWLLYDHLVSEFL